MLWYDMEEYPKTVLEFEKRFATDEDCREYLYSLRWPEGFSCPRCAGSQYWQMKGGLYRCTQCDYKASVLAGTIFQDTKQPLRLWFRAMWYVASQRHGVSARNLQQVLGLGSYRTAWTWLHKLRRAMVRPGRDSLSGMVEVDETYIGGKKPGKAGRGASGKTLVMIAVEDKEGKIGRVRLKTIPDASADSLNEAMLACVQPGSGVRTDGWPGYAQLTEKGYVHSVVAKRLSHDEENLLPLVNRVVSLLKRWLLGTHHGAVRSSHMDYYLDEFTFRFNRRTSKSRGMLFYRLAQQAVVIEPLLGKQIKGGNLDS